MKRFVHVVFIGVFVGGSIGISAQGLLTTKNESRRCGEQGTETGYRSIWKTKFAPLRTAVGDLTEDGIDETAVLIRDTEATGLLRDEILVYRTEGKEMLLLVRFAVGGPGEYVLSIKDLGSNFSIEDGSLILDLAVRISVHDDVPGHLRTVEFRWDGSKMTEVSRSAARPLPQHMREKG